MKRSSREKEMTLRRGFKSEAERIASDVRDRMGASVSQSVSPEMIADLLGIQIIAGDDLIPLERFTVLEELQPGAFSACTLQPNGNQKFVVYNPLCAKSRRTSDLAHELAHVLLNHELSRIERLGDFTFLSCDPVQEEEAAWLSGCLLLPRPLLLAEIRKGLGAKEIARKFSVSERMAKFRLNVTGVLRQHEAFEKRWRG